MEKKLKSVKKIDANAWMVTYTDLMILLLTFFVLLLSIATIDKRRKRLALNSFVGAFGFKPGGQSILGKKKGLNITLGSPPLVKEEIQFEALRNIAMTHELGSDMQLAKQIDRTVITFNNRVLFPPASDQVNPETRNFLLELSNALNNAPTFIELRGYTDYSETIFEQDPLKYSMILSTKRAFSIFNIFRENGIPSESMVAHGFGLNSPDGQKKMGAEQNRQVEIILDYNEKVPYRLKRSWVDDSILDFKGFFFRTPGKVD